MESLMHFMSPEGNMFAPSTPVVENHTYQHQWGRNQLLYYFIGVTLWNCSWVGIMYSFFFNIHSWYWDCIDNAKTNLSLV
mmetsp:Transcript_40302/g.61502  ORF Transcript_40302/g.61502 Transcript_40302/m.61502 type:complete len:80 (-) Transcript_40302:30-269(-)